MKKKTVQVHDVRAAKSIKLRWRIRRQVQQELLQKKLVQCFLKPQESHAIIKRYPEAMQPMIRDFMRKAQEKTMLFCEQPSENKDFV
ncbi:MAG TPA: hypothetical protein VMT06_02705 [Candidatus Eisenbacteria bacterium]|nr:hypothetical protein [Candidatus Eisenbacteria bacterium]